MARIRGRVVQNEAALDQRGGAGISGDADIFENAREHQKIALRSEADSQGIQVDGGFGDRGAPESRDGTLNQRYVVRSSKAISVATACAVGLVKVTFCPPVVAPEVPDPETLIPIWEIVWPVVAMV